MNRKLKKELNKGNTELLQGLADSQWKKISKRPKSNSLQDVIPALAWNAKKNKKDYIAVQITGKKTWVMGPYEKGPLLNSFNIQGGIMITKDLEQYFYSIDFN